MPALIVQQHELFARAIVGGANKADAARQAGYSITAAPNCGVRLAKREDIQRRIAELQALAQSDAETGEELSPASPAGRTAFFHSQPYIVEELVKTHQNARANKDYSTSVAALRLLAQIGGHLDREQGQRSRSRDRAVDVLLMSTAQLHQALRGQVAEITAETRQKLIAEAPELAEVIDAEVVSA